MVEVTFNIVDDSIPAEALETVFVRVLNEDGTEIEAEGYTDSSGSVVFDLEDETTYWVRCFQRGYYFERRQYAEVDSGEESNEFEIVGQNRVTYLTASDPALCRVGGETLNAAGAPVAGVIFAFSLSNPAAPRIVSGRAMFPSKVIVQSDSDGQVDVELVRGCVYNVHCSGFEDEFFQIMVPDYAYVDIAELLFPYPGSVTPAEDSVSVAAGESTTVEVTALMRSRLEVPYYLEDGTLVSASEFIEVESSDTDVATATWVDGVVGITGVAAGTATISFSLDEDSVSPRIPMPSVSYTPIIVTVE
jgi:hypothetical protein